MNSDSTPTRNDTPASSRACLHAPSALSRFQRSSNANDAPDEPLEERARAQRHFKDARRARRLLLEPAHDGRVARRVRAHAPAAQVGHVQVLADRSEPWRDAEPDEPERALGESDAGARRSGVCEERAEVGGGEDAEADRVDEIDPLHAHELDVGGEQLVDGLGRRGRAVWIGSVEHPICFW